MKLIPVWLWGEFLCERIQSNCKIQILRILFCKLGLRVKQQGCQSHRDPSFSICYLHHLEQVSLPDALVRMPMPNPTGCWEESVKLDRLCKALNAGFTAVLPNMCTALDAIVLRNMFSLQSMFICSSVVSSPREKCILFVGGRILLNCSENQHLLPFSTLAKPP